MMKRLALMVLMAVALAGCDIGGAQPTATPPASATPPPTATLPPFTTEIPPPPGGTAVKEGDDENLDLFISFVRPALEQEVAKENGQIDKQAIYTTGESVADVVTFYRDTMKANGWSESTNQASPDGSTSLGYDSGDNAAVLYISDGTDLGIDGTFVMAINLSKK